MVFFSAFYIIEVKTILPFLASNPARCQTLLLMMKKGITWQQYLVYFPSDHPSPQRHCGSPMTSGNKLLGQQWILIIFQSKGN